MSKKAQQTIEYSVILALVAAGIIMMGPYVIRSWNAHLKGAEDSILDSFNDPLVEEDHGTDLPDCTCSEWEGDPPDDCGISPCEATELKQDRTNCQPPGCENEHPEYRYGRCEPHPECCTIPEAYSETEEYCGLNVCIDIGNKFLTYNDDPVTQETWRDALIIFCDEDHIIRVDGEPGCPDGEILYYQLCGDTENPENPTPEFSCVPNDDVCKFHCGGNAVIPGLSTKCKDTGDDPNDETGLTGTIPRTFVYKCTTSEDPVEKKCEALCCPGFCAK